MELWKKGSIGGRKEEREWGLVMGLVCSVVLLVGVFGLALVM